MVTCLKRNAIQILINWKASDDRKPMVLKGARQVGKTWLMKEFGRSCYDSAVYFNFDEEDQLKSIFEANKNPHRIIELLSLIAELNGREEIDGILVQLPVPKQIDDKAIINAIDPKKDVDAFHPENVGQIMIGDYKFLPCTPAGAMELIDSTGVEISGKKCVVIGRSNIVGKPMAMLLLHRSGTVTICHSRTKDLASVTREADILVAAVGKANFVTGDMVKEGAVVIDVGINRLDNGKLCGDVKFDEVEPKASWITPVPGGVGPMTIAMLMRNTLTAAKAQHGIED